MLPRNLSHSHKYKAGQTKLFWPALGQSVSKTSGLQIYGQYISILITLLVFSIFKGFNFSNLLYIIL